MLIRTCLTFWSTVISYKKAINLDQNKLFLNTKIRKHCASTKCLNGSQIFERGTAITLGVYLGPPCRLVCKLVIENSVWHWGGAGRLQPQALADPRAWCSCSLSESPFTPVSMAHGVRSVTGCAAWRTSPPHNNLSVPDDAEELLPMAVFALKLLDSRWRQTNSDYETGDWDHTIVSPVICAAGYEPVSQWQVNKPMRYSH